MSLANRCREAATYGYMPASTRHVLEEAGTALDRADAVREATLAEVERHLSAVQYDPAPYTAMKHRLAALRAKDAADD